VIRWVQLTPEGLVLSQGTGPEILIPDATPHHAEAMRQMATSPLGLRVNQAIDAN
jgi:hypothetical protein